MSIDRSERITIAAGDVHINLHRHGPAASGTHSLGFSSFGTSFCSFDIHLTRGDMLALAEACRNCCDGPAVEDTIDTVVVSADEVRS